MEVETDENKAVEGSPSLHISEHCYCKPRDEDAEPMETDVSDGSPSLTSLDITKDTFETFLIHLLQAFTSYQRTSSPTAEADIGPTAQVDDVAVDNSTGPNKLTNSDISTESLSSLSPEQVSMLITSNSVNYEVIQQIIAQKHKQRNGALANVMLRRSNSDQSSGGLDENGLASTPPEPTAQENTESSTSNEGAPAPSRGVSTQGTEQQPQLQVTPGQLQILQDRVSEILRQQQVTLPADLSMEQQHALIQSLLIRQMNLMQEKGEPISLPSVDTTAEKAQATQPTQPSNVEIEKKQSAVMKLLIGKGAENDKTETQSSTVSSSSPAKTSSVEIVASKPSTSGGGRKRKSGDQNEPKKPPMPYNIFFSEVYSTVLAANQKMAFAEASKIISMMWNAMGTDVKKKYYDQHEKLKQEYKEAMQKYQQTKSSATSQREGEKQVASSLVRLQREPKDPKLCVNDECTNEAVFSEDRGPKYCSNECVVSHCRNEFTAYVNSRKIKV